MHLVAAEKIQLGGFQEVFQEECENYNHVRFLYLQKSDTFPLRRQAQGIG